MNESRTIESDPLLDAVAARPAVGLDQLDLAAGLRRRFDDKFLIDQSAALAFVAGLGPDWVALEAAGVRSTTYVTTYFDTVDLRCYRDHLQGRRRRFKVRTRRYGDADSMMLELKLKGRAGQTVKHRWPLAGEEPLVLDLAAMRLLDDTIQANYGWPIQAELGRTVQTRYERITLANLARSERITIDRRLSTVSEEGCAEFDASQVLVETKATTRHGEGFNTMVRLGHRPRRVSKYCLGVVALRPGVRGNPWLSTLRHLDPQVTPRQES